MRKLMHWMHTGEGLEIVAVERRSVWHPGITEDQREHRREGRYHHQHSYKIRRPCAVNSLHENRKYVQLIVGLCSR